MTTTAAPPALASVLGAGPLGAARGRALAAIATAAAAVGTRAWLVGGAVRDALLGLDPGDDLDVVVVGDALAVARHVVAAHGGRPVVHRRFGTATWRPDGLAIDLVSARSETYARPGALPTVRPGGLPDDLARRDFALNALAVALEGGGLGALIDPHDGRVDIDGGLVRILHARSFVDDPTRILRAVRFAARLGFALAPETERRAREAIAGGALATVSPARIGRELAAVFREARPGQALLGLEALGVVAALRQESPDGAASGRERAALVAGDGAARAADALPAGWSRLARGAPGLELPAAPAPSARRAIWVAGALPDTGSWHPARADEARLVESLRRPVPEALAHGAPSALVDALGARPPMAIAGAWLASAAPAARTALRRYAEIAGGPRCPIDGDDLRAIGIAAGPALGRILATVRSAWLDGRVASRDAALRLAATLAAESDVAP